MATFVTTFSDTNGKGTIKLYPDQEKPSICWILAPFIFQ